jgi:hypothetical protein
MQAEVSLTALARENCRFNALPIVAHTQSELLLVIADFNLDFPCLRMLKGVSQRLGRNFVNLIAKDGMKIA